jgi:hypothetical protein
MSDTPQDLSQVETLLEERDAVHAWLTKLDASSSTVPTSVKDRVRADYKERLEGITAELGTHADAVAEKLVTDRAEHDELSESMNQVSEALAEVELRHAVGEFDSEKFEAEHASHVGDLETYEMSILAVAERITRMEDVEAFIARAPKPISGENPAALATEESSEVVEELPGDAELAGIEDPEDVAAAIEGRDELDVDELKVELVVEGEVVKAETGSMISINELMASGDDEPVEVLGTETPGDLQMTPRERIEGPDAEALLSVFGDSMSIEVDDLPPEVPVDPSASLLDLEEIPDRPEDDMMADFGPLSFTRTGENPVPVPAAPPPMGMPPADQVPRFVRPATQRGSELSEMASLGKESPSEGSDVEGGDIPMPPNEADAVPRTLRCGECGAMNRPLEWYCEKCGAELTAV